jgi:erythromycin esterase
MDKINTQFADSILKDIIQPTTKIIVLGEENHGGEITNQLNAELIVLLVEKYGFKTLLFESDFFSLSYSETLDKTTTFQENIYAAWSKSEAFKNVNKLYRNDQLEILGFDSKHHGENAKSNLVNYLKSQLKSISDFDSLFFTITNSLVKNEFSDTLLIPNNIAYFKFIKDWQNALTGKKDYLFHVLTNLTNYANQVLIEKQSSPDKYVAYREKAMIDNIAYLLEHKSPLDKFIVLGATVHLQPGVTELTKHAEKNVGDYIYEFYKSESQFIFPIVYSGLTQNYNASKPQKNNKKAKRNTLLYKLAKSKELALFEYCYNANYELFPLPKSLKTKDFCGYFIFIKEEYPRIFFRK